MYPDLFTPNIELLHIDAVDASIGIYHLDNEYFQLWPDDESGWSVSSAGKTLIMTQRGEQTGVTRIVVPSDFAGGLHVHLRAGDLDIDHWYGESLFLHTQGKAETKTGTLELKKFCILDIFEQSDLDIQCLYTFNICHGVFSGHGWATIHKLCCEKLSFTVLEDSGFLVSGGSALLGDVLSVSNRDSVLCGEFANIEVMKQGSGQIRFVNSLR
jgi:hypothetical protein